MIYTWVNEGRGPRNPEPPAYQCSVTGLLPQLNRQWGHLGKAEFLLDWVLERCKVIKNLPSFLNIIVLLYVEIWREGLVLAGMSLKEQYATDIENFCPGSLHLSTPLALMLWSLKDQRSWRVVTRWHLDIMLSDALSPLHPTPPLSPLPLPLFLPSFLPPSLPPSPLC